MSFTETENHSMKRGLKGAWKEKEGDEVTSGHTDLELSVDT